MIDPQVIRRNILHTAAEASLQLSHAATVQGRARSGYYKAAFLLTASIIEAILFFSIERMLHQNPRLAKTNITTKLKELHSLPDSLGSTKRLIICERVEQDYKLTPRSSFSSMILFCFSAQLINGKLHKKLQQICNKRNEIHLQGLQTTHKRYNRALIENAYTALQQLSPLLATSSQPLPQKDFSRS